MIISHERRFVFLGIPRTANRATHRALLQLPAAFKLGLLHNMEVPSECRSYFTFCAVRNPYRRFLAYYLWRHQKHSWGGDAVEMTFADYVGANEAEEMGPRTLREFTRDLRLDHVYRYENLPRCLAEIEAIPELATLELPIQGQRLSRHWRHYYDEQLAERVYTMTRGDFEEFGYDRDSWRID